GAHLLDVPCGIGRRAVGLAESGFEVTAVDPNEIGIAAAKERIAGTIADRLHLASASHDTMPGLPAGTRFDAILCLDHALGRESTAAESPFSGPLRPKHHPGGSLFLTPLNADSF